jgi:hypothetical protein
MSFLTGTNTEVIAASAVAGPTISSATTKAPIGYPVNAAYLPIGFFNTNAIGKTLRVVANGIYTTPASGLPTYTFGVSINATQGSTTASSQWLTGALTPPVSMTNAFWYMDMEITLASFTAAQPSVMSLVGMGFLALQNSTTSTAGAVYGLGSTTAVTAYNMQTAAFLEVIAFMSAATTGCAFTMEKSTIYGCN